MSRRLQLAIVGACAAVAALYLHSASVTLAQGLRGPYETAPEDPLVIPLEEAPPLES